ncbi:MAG: M14 family metallopeptidase, partial [Saprospiraceae bacterium]
MKKFILLYCFILLAISVFAQESYSRVRIVLNEVVTMPRLASLGLETDHGNHQNTYFETDFSAAELELLTQHQIPFQIIIDDVTKFYAERNKSSSLQSVENKKRAVTCHLAAPIYNTPAGFNYGSMGSFLTYQEVLQKMDSLAILFPNLATSKQAIGTYQTEEGRSIYYLKISDNPNTNEMEPQIMYNAAHHAREAITPQQILYFMYYLCENYNTNTDIKRLVDNIEFYFVPVVNPDGYEYNQTTNPLGGGLWRKNRRNTGGGIYGVDLNRNYGLGWGYNNIGSSPNANSNAYRGTSGFSEPETKAMKDFCNIHQFQFGVSYHSYSNLLIYPLGYLGKNCDDSVYFRAFCTELALHNSYKFGIDAETVGYTTNGSSDDWLYGETITKPLMYAITPEVGDGNDGFWPQTNRILPLCEEANYMNLTLAKYLLKYAAIENVTPRIANSSSGFIKYNINRLGLQANYNYTVTLQAISPQIAAIGIAKNYSSLNLGVTYTDSISYTLQNGLLNNTQLQFALNVSDGSFSETDTVSIYYGNNEINVFASDCSSFANWTAGGFVIDTTKGTSGNNSLAENASGNYPFNEDVEITTSNIDLSQSIRAELLYRTTWAMENSVDYAQLL